MKISFCPRCGFRKVRPDGVIRITDMSDYYNGDHELYRCECGCKWSLRYGHINVFVGVF